MRTLIALLYLFSISIISCNSSLQNNREYVNYIDSEKSGLTQSKDVLGLKIECSLKTPEYILIREKSKDESINSVELSSEEISDAAEGIYFDLTIKDYSNNDPLKKSLRSEAEYFSRLQAVETAFSQYLTVIHGRDTLQNIYAVYERDFGVSGSMHICLAYKDDSDKKISKPLKVIYNDQILQTGITEFYYTESTFQNLAQLKTPFKRNESI